MGDHCSQGKKFGRERVLQQEHRAADEL